LFEVQQYSTYGTRNGLPRILGHLRSDLA
jgi:hypothetical protein